MLHIPSNTEDVGTARKEVLHWKRTAVVESLGKNFRPLLAAAVHEKHTN
jgi:hypothetical protein